jgi:hypothetical protein
MFRRHPGRERGAEAEQARHKPLGRIVAAAKGLELTLRVTGQTTELIPSQSGLDAHRHPQGLEVPFGLGEAQVAGPLAGAPARGAGILAATVRRAHISPRRPTSSAGSRE